MNRNRKKTKTEKYFYNNIEVSKCEFSYGLGLNQMGWSDESYYEYSELTLEGKLIAPELDGVTIANIRVMSLEKGIQSKPENYEHG